MTEITKSIFREYDIRGIYPSEINESLISLIAKAISIKCDQENVSDETLRERKELENFYHDLHNKEIDSYYQESRVIAL